jgi:spore maturation protein CgeB
MPFVDAAVSPLGCDFLLPFLTPCARFVDDPAGADFILALNDSRPDAVARLVGSRRWGRPLAWWTIEDPNHFDEFLPQAAVADFVFTTDEACIPRYVSALRHNRVFWLPLACSPEFHGPLQLTEDATDFVLSANWYRYEARRWGVATVVDPLRRAGCSLTLFSYEKGRWPAEYLSYWRGEMGPRTTAEQYRHGRVVLGLNNQRWGVGTSMRTFEALACAKPFLAAHSEAYDRLGLVHGEHMAWIDRAADALPWGRFLLGTEGEAIGRAGRAFVLAHHTYAHRLARIAEAVLTKL